MTNEEAIKLIERHNEIHSQKEKFAVHITEALHMAIIALRSHTSIEPIPHIVTSNESPIIVEKIQYYTGTTVYKCPNCLELLPIGQKRCLECGQLINWDNVGDNNRY